MPGIARALETFKASGRSPLRWLSAVSFSGLVLAPVLLCVWFVCTFAVDVPVYDQWHCVATLNKLQHGHVGWLDVFLLQHGKHLVGVPFVLMAVLAPHTGYDTRAEMFAGILVMVSAGVALALMVKERLPRPMTALVGVIPLTWLVISVRQHEALIGGVMGGFEHIAVSAFFVLTVFFLDRVEKVGCPLFLAMFTALCSVFSLGNGILILPLGTLQLAVSCFGFRRIPGALAAGVIRYWILFSLVVGSTYLLVYRRSIDPVSWDYFKNNPYADLQFFLAFLGSPLNVTGDAGAAIATALVLAGILAVIVAAVAVKRERLTASMVAPAILGSYALISATLITIGRAHFGVEQATTSRYVCISYVGVAALYVLVLSAGKIPAKARTFLLAALAVLMVRGSVAGVEDGLLWGRVRHYYRLGIANLLYNYKLNETSSLRPLGLNPERVRAAAAFLEKNHLSVFRREPPPKPGSPVVAPAVGLESIAARAEETGEGLPVFAVDEGTQKNISFSGWVVDQASRGPAGGVTVCVGDRLEIPSAYGLDRPDIASTWRKRRCLRSGFSTRCLTSLIGSGSHKVSLKVLSPDRKTYWMSPPLALLRVEDSGSTKLQVSARGTVDAQ